jgi:hypothetical protein
MHTAHDIKSEFFLIEVGDSPATRDELLDWGIRDRFGVVVSEPLGALGAGLMILLAATAFYDVSKPRRRRPLYPELFLFHAGGPWGSHISFDFAPDHKEVFVPRDPAEILRAVNNRGITHLLVPDCVRRPVKHRYKEPEAAVDRIKVCLAYGPAGEVSDADVRVTARPFAPLLGSYESALYPHALLEILENTGRSPEVRAVDSDELNIMLALQRARATEVSADHPGHQRAAKRVAQAKQQNALTETYRRIDVAAALEMLH